MNIVNNHIFTIIKITMRPPTNKQISKINMRSQSTVNTEQPDDKEFPPKFTRQLYFTELHSSTIIKFNLFTELCVARLTGNEGRKLLLGLGWAGLGRDKI